MFDDFLGLDDYEFDGESVATARMPVTDAVRQPFGIVFTGTGPRSSPALHRGRTSWVWNVEMTDDEGRLCAS